jgi:hypothetical protein
MRVPFILQAVMVAISTPFQKIHVANIYGHKTRKKGFMHDGTSTSIMEMPLAENGHPDYCLDCISKMSIRCAWCGESIVIGEHITLDFPHKEFRVPDYAVKYGEGEEQALVGCLRWACADTLAMMCGHWMPPGVVKRVPSPLDIALQTGKAVIVDDVRNYPASISLHDV